MNENKLPLFLQESLAKFRNDMNSFVTTFQSGEKYIEIVGEKLKIKRTINNIAKYLADMITTIEDLKEMKVQSFNFQLST